MNKMPLPIHLLAEIPGYSMMGQTSFAGYIKIVCAWWSNNCPELFDNNTEWCSLSGMYTRDYVKHRAKIEPMVRQSFDVLKKYREERRAKTEHLRKGIHKARAVKMQNDALRRQQAIKPAAIVDKHTPVNPAPAAPDFKPFHEGWNLNKSAPTAKTPRQQKAFLKDK